MESMNREIKFRGLSIQDKVWKYGGFYREGDVYFIRSKTEYPNNIYVSYQAVPESTSQYTGLKDINGKEIYEGDVIKITEEDEDSVSGIENEYMGEVVFGNGNKGNYISYYPASFCVLVKGWYMDQGLLGNYRHRYEVIGNIYQNPELLKP